MTLYDLVKKYGDGRGEDTMWKAVRIISDSVESVMDEQEKAALMRKVYCVISDKHYNEDYAHNDVAGMYYLDSEKKKHFAPYWTEEDVQDVYEDVRDAIPDYNFWDFFVAMNMVASDNWMMLKRWFPGIDAKDLNRRIAEMTVSWLNDEDWPTKTKIWDYLSAR